MLFTLDVDAHFQSKPNHSLSTGENGTVKIKKKFVHPKKTPEERKSEKEKRQQRKARVILRNLSFKVTENDLKKEFAKYGQIKDCNLLKREDGKLVGCAFIQYDKVNHAAKAIHHANGKELHGRQIIIDWAVNRKQFVKHLYQQKQSQKQKIKTEDENDEINTKIKVESDNDNSEDESHGSERDESVIDDAMKSDSDNTDDDEDDDENAEDDNAESDEDKKKPIHTKSNDVAEGCTVFIKNIPFESTKDDLYKACRQFGPLYYAVITIDKMSGHSKGNGFVKFKVMPLKSIH